MTQTHHCHGICLILARRGAFGQRSVTSSFLASLSLSPSPLSVLNQVCHVSPLHGNHPGLTFDCRINPNPNSLHQLSPGLQAHPVKPHPSCPDPELHPVTQELCFSTIHTSVPWSTQGLSFSLEVDSGCFCVFSVPHTCLSICVLIPYLDCLFTYLSPSITQEIS